LIPLYICIVFYIIHPLFLSRLSYNHLLGCLINFLDMVLSSLSATLFSRPLFLRTHFALSKAFFLFPDYIVAHRLLRRPHDVSEQAQRLRSEDDADIFFGAMRAELLTTTNRFYFTSYALLDPAWADAHPFPSLLSPFA